MTKAKIRFLTPMRSGLIRLACILFPVAVWAQSSTTSLSGTVQDSSGAVVAGAVLTIENKSNGFHAITQSDAKGQYEFVQLAPGTYEITAKGSGFGDQVKVAQLLVSQPATVVFVLSVKAKGEAVNVSATTETLNTTDATIGNSVSNSTIEALPMEGRNVPDLLSLQPGVLYLGRQIDPTIDSRSGAVSGARSDQTNVTLDGVDDNDQTNGFAFTGVLRSTLDSVEEFRVTTTSANADAGRNSGAQVVLVTKSGTNHLHGGLYEYNRNTIAVANDWFNKQAELSQGLPNKPGELIRNTFGGTFGGPIKKNRLFFFVNFEEQRTAENQQQTLTVPTASLRAGDVSYLSSTGSTVTLTPSQIAAMDPGCTVCSATGPGVDPNTLAVFNQYPLPNGLVYGDGLNTASFTWSAPNPTVLKTYIAKIDYIAGSHRIFARGNLQNDNTSGVPQFPGDAPSYILRNNSKGVVVGDVWTIRKNLINSFHYGYIRQGIPNGGAGNGPYVDFIGLSSLYAENRTTNRDVPVHNFIDDITWLKHDHTIQVGVNYRLIHNLAVSDATSWDSADGNFSYINLSGIANTGQNFDPGAFGYPAVAGSFANSYNNAIIAAAGLISDVNTSSNYAVSASGATGNLLPQGAMINRDYKNSEFEYYLQDSWKVRRNLNLVFGLRHTLLQTPYEIHGQQVQSVTDLQNWFQTRTQFAQIGQVQQPYLYFAPSGQARGLKPYWPMNKNNVAPRFAVAYAPSFKHGVLSKIFGSNNNSSLRAGFGMYYDHFGQGIVNSFSQLGSFSLTSTQTGACGGICYVPSIPRFTAINVIPPGGIVAPASVAYPDAPLGGLSDENSLGVDDHLKTPYSYAFNTSFQRQLRAGFTLEVAYVGRLGRHLLQQYDWGEPLDLVDPKTGVDYFTAATQLSKLGYSGATTVAPIPYWENLWPGAAQGGLSATQNIYNLWKTLLGNETFSLFLLDVACAPAYCNGQTNRYFSPQYGALFAWNSLGNSSYNAGQIVLRHPMTHGLQFDFNYTLGKSLDLGSDTERTCQFCRGGVFGPIISTWRPRDNYAVSDFDTRHLVTFDWVYALPFGRHYAGIRRGFLGWQVSGLTRWTSGLPFSILQSSNWSTNWTQVSWLEQTGPVKTRKHIAAAGVPQAFADPTAIQTGYLTGYPERNAYPGEAGQRNPFRGDGYFGIDSGLSKSWTIREGQNLKFAWEIFNVTNSVRFDVHSINNDASSGGFGDYTSTLTAPRVQQFSLRYSF